MKKLVYSMFASSHRRRALAQLRDLEARLPSPAARFAVPFVFRGSGLFRSMAPKQNPAEIEALYRAVCELRPGSVLEIGTAKGGTLYLWSQASADNATIVSVDLPGGEFGGGYPPARVPFYQGFARTGQRIELVRADSHSPATLAQVRALLPLGKLDFLFIDGDHAYGGVKQDFEQYAPLVRPGGLIAMHDILPRPDAPTIQVHRFWQEVRGRYESQEFVGTGHGRTIGIGLLKVKV